MNKSVSEMAKEMGLIDYSFDEIFELSHSAKEIVSDLSKKGICTNVEKLREILEFAGKRCTLTVGFIDSFKEGINKAKHDIECNIGDTYMVQKWLTIIQTHRDVYEMMGFLTLLQMDAITTTISLLQATNETERIMLCKHAYTIIYEAKENDLFKKVSAGMQKYPEDLVKSEDVNSFWKDIKAILKKLMDTKEAKDIRNNLDAHKSHSFMTQISFYKKCDWARSVINLSLFIMIIDKIQTYMDIIHDNINRLYDQYIVFMEDRMNQYEAILKQLQDYNELTK